MPSTVIRGGAGRRAVRVRRRRPVRRAGAPLPLPRELRPRAQPLRPPARLALRGDRRGRRLRRRARPVRALLPPAEPRALQRDLHRDVGGRAHDPPGRHEDDGQDGVHARARLAADRGDRDRGLPARAGEDRRGDHRRRDRQGAPARCRGRRARPNRFGIFTPAWAPLNACRNWYPRFSQRFPEILRQLGSSGLMALPTEADAFGPAREDVERFLQGAAIDGIDRVRLFRLAWDTCLSAFAGPPDPVRVLLLRRSRTDGRGPGRRATTGSPTRSACGSCSTVTSPRAGSRTSRPT